MKAKIIAFSLACFMGLGLIFVPTVSAAEGVDCTAGDLTPVQQLSCGIEATNPNVSADDADNQVITVIRAAINLLSMAVGVISVIVIIVQGMRLILSGGNEKTTKEARKRHYLCAGWLGNRRFSPEYSLVGSKQVELKHPLIF